MTRSEAAATGAATPKRPAGAWPLLRALPPTGASLAARIAEQVVAAIDRGDLRPGDRLPTRRDIAARYAVAPTTAYEAIRSLVDAGVLVSVPGRGAFVPEVSG